MDQQSHDDPAVEKWAEREEAHARHVTSTAKVVVTFWAAIAATFVATAIQTPDNRCLDRGAALLTGLALLITALVVGLPSRPREAKLRIDNVSRPLARQDAALAMVKRAECLHVMMMIQVGLCIIASLLAGIGLLLAKSATS